MTAVEAVAVVAADLAEYLREQASRPFDWRTHNCGHFICEWIEARRGINPGREYARAFEDENQFGQFLSSIEKTSLVEFAESIALQYGLKQIVRPTCGDVAVVSVRGIGGRAVAVFAIKTERFFAILSARRGVVLVRTKARTAWNVSDA